LTTQERECEDGAEAVMEERDASQIDALRQTIAEHTWYHVLDLGDGIITPGLSQFKPVWDNIRRARQHLDYHRKSVLDLGSMEGLWAFEAEQLGAETVVATDCWYDEGGALGNPLERFLLCRAVLGSKVIPYYNVSPYRLSERLDLFLQETRPDRPLAQRRFDVVQHLGLLYHLRDPLLSLLQSRSVMRTGAHLLIETAVVADETSSYMLFNGVPPQELRIYQDFTTWWAPTIPCLLEMLRASLFRPLSETMSATPPYSQGEHSLQRAAIVCEAVGAESVPPNYYRELTRTYRNPGLAFPPD
jgi:SAM-dependent methyltransferase